MLLRSDSDTWGSLTFRFVIHGRFVVPGFIGEVVIRWPGGEWKLHLIDVTQILKAVHLYHGIRDGVENVAYVERPLHREGIPVVVVFFFRVGQLINMTDSAFEPETCLRGDVEYVGALPDGSAPGPGGNSLRIFRLVYLSNRNRYHHQVPRLIKEKRLVVPQDR